MIRRRRIVLGAVCTLVVAGAFFVWQGRHGDGSAPPAATAAKKGGKTVLPPIARGLAAGEDEHGASALDVDVAADPTGTMRLEGQVVDEASLPIAGAVVSISTNPPREATTEGDGAFAFDGLLARRYTVVARAGDTSAGPISIKVSDTTEPAILVVRAAARVEVTVIAATDRTPIADATVELRGGQTLSATTDQKGVATLRGAVVGIYTVAARAPGYGPAYASVSIASAGQKVAAHLSLQPGVPLSGRVVDDRKRGIAGARVTFERASDAPWARPDATRDGATSDEGGRFRFDALPVGTYRFLATHDEAAPSASTPITVDGRRPVEGVEIVLAPGARLAGKVVAKNGEPLAGVAVRVGPQDQGARARPRQTTTDANGAFRLTGLPRRPVWLVATGERATSETLAFDLGDRPERDDVVVTLTVDGVIAGVVVNDQGTPIPGAQVAALPELSGAVIETSRLRTAATDITDGAGAFRLAGLPVGTYSMHAYRFGVPAAAEWLPDGVKAQVGDEHVKILLRDGGTVKGKVAFADGTAPSTYLVRLGMSPPSAFSDPGGVFHLDDLPPSRVTLLVSGVGFENAMVENVDIKPGESTDVGTVTVTKGRTISGHVLSSDGQPVAGAQVFAGKRVIGTGDGLTTQVWGPPGGPGATLTDTSDETGLYLLRGVAAVDLVLVADHPSLGRSQVVRLPVSTESATVDLTLQPQGSIEGVVTRGGQPIAGMTVNASPQLLAHSSNFVVSTGADGSYRFDKLTADHYVVSATGGMHPIVGVNQTAVAVVLEAGQTAVANIDLPAVTTTLTVTLVDHTGQPVRLAEVHALGGTFSAVNAGQVHDAEAAVTGGFSSFNIVIDERPAQIKNIPPGPLSVCVVAYPRELVGKDAVSVSKFVSDHGRQLPAVCSQLTITGEPQQATTVVADPPPMPGDPNTN